MFQRIEWQAGEVFWPVLSFLLIAGAFAVIVWRAWRMPKQRRDRMAHTPLEHDESPRDET